MRWRSARSSRIRTASCRLADELCPPRVFAFERFRSAVKREAGVAFLRELGLFCRMVGLAFPIDMRERVPLRTDVALGGRNRTLLPCVPRMRAGCAFLIELRVALMLAPEARGRAAGGAVARVPWPALRPGGAGPAAPSLSTGLRKRRRRQQRHRQQHLQHSCQIHTCTSFL